MRIIIATPYIPWPLGTGGAAAQFSTLQSLCDDHQFTLICPTYSDAHEKHVRILAAKLPKVKIRSVYVGAPKPKAPIRMLKAAKIKLREMIKGPYGGFSEGAPYYPFSPLSEGYINTVTEELKRGADLFQAEFSETLPLAYAAPATVPKLFIQHQIHFVYTKRFMEAHGASTYSQYLASWMEAQERLYLRHFDGIIAFSDKDKKVLEKLPGIAPVFTSPFPIPADVGISVKEPQTFSGRFLFLGSQEHGPNREALAWLLKDVWPLITTRMPAAKLVVIGPWSEAFRKIIKEPSVSFSGFVEDLNSTIEGGIMLVPLRVGSGIRTKILVSLAQAVPTVTTPIGVEGLSVRDGEDLLIRQEPAEFAEAAVRLAADPVLWKKLAISGRETVAQHYSQQEVRRRRNEIYAILAAHKGKRPTSVDATAPLAS